MYLCTILLYLARTNLIPAKLPPENIKAYEISWTRNGVDPSIAPGKWPDIEKFILSRNSKINNYVLQQQIGVHRY